MTVEAHLVADSINAADNRLATFVLKYGRGDHAELMTHRAFSRNSGSSRAVPFSTTVKRVLDEPFIPEFWGKRSAGMQPSEDVDDATRLACEAEWLSALRDMQAHAQRLYDLGIHKLRPNRLLEPFSHIEVVVSATEWHNWFLLRDDKGAEFHIRKLAHKMGELMKRSEPKFRSPASFCHYVKADPWKLNFYGDDTPKIVRRTLEYGLQDSWHMPFIPDRNTGDFWNRLRESVAHNAWVSFLNEWKTEYSQDDVNGVYNRLVGSQPIHASPTEHVAVACGLPNFSHNQTHRHNNFVGWVQLRAFLPNESGGDYLDKAAKDV